MKILPVVLSVMLLGGCAVSPYAWKDLGDGEGMRGWAGIPLKDSMAYAAAMQANRREWVNPVHIPAVTTSMTSPDGRFTNYYTTGGY